MNSDDNYLYLFEKGISQGRQGEVHAANPHVGFAFIKYKIPHADFVVHEPKPDTGKNVNQTSIKQESLRAAGYSYLVGDAALFASGMMSGRKHEALSGAAYTVGSLALARYGRENAERRLQTLQGRLKEYFANENIAVQKGSELNTLTLKGEGGLVDHIEDFLYAHPSEMFNTMNVLGGSSLLRSGIKHGKGWDTASGALVVAGGLAGFIPEKQPDPDHRAEGPPGKAWEWVQEKPLRISGGLYIASKPALIKSALEERKTNPLQKSYLFKFLAAASYIVADVLLSISSKDSASYIEGDNKKAMEKLEATAARVIAAQPEELRMQVIQQTAGFLAAQPDIKLPATLIANELTERINELSSEKNKNWQKKIQQQMQNKEFNSIG